MGAINLRLETACAFGQHQQNTCAYGTSPRCNARQKERLIRSRAGFRVGSCQVSTHLKFVAHLSQTPDSAGAPFPSWSLAQLVDPGTDGATPKLSQPSTLGKACIPRICGTTSRSSSFQTWHLESVFTTAFPHLSINDSYVPWAV